jgi:hypothetical protein
MWPVRSWVSMLPCGQLRPLYIFAAALEGSAESNVTMRGYLGEYNTTLATDISHIVEYRALPCSRHTAAIFR